MSRVLVLLTLLFCAPLWAQGPRVGLVLSGGGARGAAHIGVLRVLEQAGVKVDAIAGTSMGAVIGGLYASGLSVDEIETALRGMDWNDVLTDATRRQDRSFRRKRDDDEFLVKAKPGLRGGTLVFPPGLAEGQKLLLILKALTLPVARLHDFDRLSIPFRAVATDIVTGERVVLGSGDLATAMRASMSVPGVFSPVELDQRLLVDGGMADNLPVQVVREMGVDRVIAVDISTPLKSRGEITDVFAIADQLTNFLTQANTRVSKQALTKQDLLIVPTLDDLSSTDFARSAEAIAPGEAAARQAWRELRGLAREEGESRQPPAVRVAVMNPPIEFVRIENRSSLSDAVFKARLHQPLGEPLDRPQVEADIAAIYGLDLFQRVSYRLVDEQGRHGLVLEVVEKPWGPNYLQGGLSLEGDLSGGNRFDVALGYTRSAITGLGGEWRNILQLGEDPRLFTELYLPFRAGPGPFINPSAEFRRSSFSLFEGGNRIAEYRVNRFLLGLEGGWEFGNSIELRGGYRWFSGDAQLRIGSRSLPDGRFRGGELFTQVRTDTLDNIFFPSRGASSRLRLTVSRGRLGADASFEQASVSGLGAWTSGRNSLVLLGRADTTPGEDAPLQSLFRLGGFLNLSGLPSNALSGQHRALLTTLVRRRINDFNLLPTYLGISLEVGNTWNRYREVTLDSLLWSGSLFLGVDTPMGPLYMGYGLTQEGDDSAFLFLGRRLD